MITLIIFSKDRPAQLDLLLRSIKINLIVPHTVFVQYTASTNEYQKGYDICNQKYKISLIKENDFKKTLIKTMMLLKTNIMFLVDDNVFINRLEENEFLKLLDIKNNNNKVHTLSLRMHENIDFCYPAKKRMIIPTFINNKDFLMWDWTLMDPWTCWGYPMHIDSQIFTKEDLLFILSILFRENYHHPNSLEEAFLRNKNKNKNLMVSLTKTIVWNIQNNFVQGNQSVSDKNIVEENNKLFLSGKEISMDNIQGVKVNMAHGILDFIWK